MFDFGKAMWIWNDDIDTVNNYLQFKKVVNISDVSTVEIAEILVTADTNYSLWVNGKFVDCGLYQYGENKFAVDRLNIKSYLVQGENVFCFGVHYQGVRSSQYFKKRAGLIYQIKIDDILYNSDSTTYVRKDPCYLTGEYSKTSRQLGFNFLYDATNEDNWLTTIDTEPSFAESSCTEINSEIFVERPIAKCIYKPLNEGELIAGGYYKRVNKDSDDIAMLMQSDYLQTLPIKQVIDNNRLVFSDGADGVYLLYDLLYEDVGQLSIKIDAEKPTTIDISYGEHLSDLRVRAKIHDRNFANRYICKKGKQEFTHYFSRISARYLQLHIANNGGSVDVESVAVLPVEYPVQEQNHMQLSDALYNKIYDVSKRTLHICMHEHYEDTPWREQALYAMDSRNQALFGYYCFGEFDFARESLNLLGESIKGDKYLRITAPNETEFCIPCFSLIWITSIYEYMLYSGDIDFANKYLTQCADMIDQYISSTYNGLPCPPQGENYWNFYDWAEGLSGNTKADVDVLYLLFLIQAMQSYDKMALYCNVDKRYSVEIATIQNKIGEMFWDENNGVYATFVSDNTKHHYCVLAQALAITTGTCPPAKIEELRASMTQQETLVKTTLSLTIFSVEALMGEREKYLPHILDMLERQWGGMLYKGATSFWETEKGEQDFDGAGSLSHGWSTLPIYIFGAYILGLKPTKPGFEEFECNPIGNKLLSAKFVGVTKTITVDKSAHKYDIVSKV